jgi:hypothetical protein
VFANFVTTSGTVLDAAADGVSYSVIIRERGDANADGDVNPVDMTAVKKAYYSNASLPCWPAADCNADENVDPVDMTCIKKKYYSH